MQSKAGCKFLSFFYSKTRIAHSWVCDEVLQYQPLHHHIEYLSKMRMSETVRDNLIPALRDLNVTSHAR